MADKKKVYSIVINGLKESVDLVDSLNNQLKELDKNINAVKDKTIKIKGEVEVTNMPEQKVVVGGGSSSGGTSEKNTGVEAQKTLEIEKQKLAAIKAQAQAEAALNEEYQEAYKKTLEQKEALKETKKEIEAAAANQRILNDAAGNYSNTMKGMKQELSDLKKVRDNLDLAKPEDVERFKQIQERALELETLLKSIESEAGVFSRNVGNYPQLLKQATTEWENVQKIIASLSDKLSKATPGTEGYDKLKSELEQAEKYAQKLDERLGDIKDNINQINSEGFKLDVGGKEREFNSLKDAVKTLTKELQEMTLAGETETDTFEATITALGKVKTAIKSVSGEVQSYIGNTKGLSDTIETMQGLAGIAGIGMGLSQLFGSNNDELDETLKKFTAMTLILQGVLNLQQQINDTNSKFGQRLSAAYEWTKKLISNIPVIGSGIDKVAEKASEFNDKIKAMNELANNFAPGLKTAVSAFDSLVSVSDELKNKWDELSASQKFLVEQLSGTAMSGDVDLADIPVDEEKVKEFLGMMQELQQTNPQLAEQFKNLSGQIGQYTQNLSQATVQAKGLSNWQVKLATGTGMVSKGFRAVSAGIKTATAAFKGFLAATVILLAVQAAVEALMWAVEGLINVFKSMFTSAGLGAMELEDRMEALDARISISTETLNKYLTSLDRLQKSGTITELEKERLAFDAMRKEIEKAGKELQRFLKTQDEFEVDDLSRHLNNSNIWGDEADIKNIDDFKAHYEALVKAVEAGTDVIKAGWDRGSEDLLTAGDAVEQLEDDTKAVLGAIGNELNQSFARYEREMSEAGDNVNKQLQAQEQMVKDFTRITDNQLYKSALANMHTLFKEEEWAQSLDRLYKYFDTTVQNMEKRAEDLKVAIARANKDLADAAELSTINAIEDANKRQDALDAYNKKKRQQEINATVADEEYKQKALAALDAEYETKRKDRIKQRIKSSKSAGADEYSIMKQIRDNLLTLQAEGLEKEKQKLKNAMDDELNSAKKAGKLRGELEESIRNKYQKKIEDLEKEWYKNQLKQREAFNKEMIKMAQEAADELLEIQNAAAMNNINRGLDQAENTNIKRTATISYDTTIDTSTMSFEDNDKNLENQKKYYQEMLKAQSEYIAEKTKLQLEESLTNEEQLKQQAEREYRQRLESNKEWQEKQLEELNKAAQDGLVTEEEYHERLDQLTQTYQIANADTYEAYQTKLNELTKNGEQERDNIVSQGRQEQQRINDEANQKAISAIQEYYNEIADIADREQKKNMNRHTGLFNYSAEKERLEKVKAEYEKVMSDLEADYEKLKEQYNAGDIDFDQFQNGKKQIEDLKKTAQKAADETSESLSDLFQNWAGSVNDFASKIASQFQEMFSTFQNIQSLMLDAEQNQLDKEQEILDKQKDAVDKAYEKQAEIVERYRDKINDTEDELKNARGERREALIDSLAQQREAYLAETATLKQQELEKEKIAQKEEQLKKKQDALEKKRKKQQQAASVVNAIINTALGVTQALAAWPPPASYALAAAVGALGAVEIALIASQKYAKGGLIEGPDHAHGGVKVQTKKGIAEVEGNEYIVNKKTTTENLSLIEFVNSKKRRLNLDDFIEFYSGKAKYTKSSGSSLKFADGGTMPELTDFSDYQASQPVVVDLTIDSKVSTVDIINSIDRVTQTRVLAGL